jgi:hypothetical protein
MAVATVVVQQWTGAGPTKTTVTVPRMSTSDSAAPGTANPIPIPAASFNFSFWMSLFLTITAMNAATLINNHKFYSDGSVGWTTGSGGGLLVCKKSTGDNGLPGASYLIATGTVGTTGYDSDDVTNGHTYYKSGTANHAVPVSVATYTSGSMLTIDSGDHTIAEAFKGVVLQAKIDTVANGAVRGVQTAETLTFTYDEV